MNLEQLKQLIKDESAGVISNKLLGAFAEELQKKKAGLVGGSYKGYNQLFEKDNPDNDGFESFEKFFETVRGGRADARLKTLVEGESDSGGFLVPEEYRAELIDAGLENEIVRPRATVYPMAGKEINVPGFLLGDHSTDGVYGGITEHWSGEATSATETDPKFTKIKLVANKLRCYAKSSDELKTDSAIPFETMIGGAFGGAISFFMDYRFLQGSGVGQPLGVLNSPCLVSVAKESEQAADTISYENLTKMLSHLMPSAWAGAVWVAHINTLPQLLGLSIVVGTGGSHYPVLTESSGKFSMLGHPVIFSEKLNTLGDKGDILLANFRYYAVGLKNSLRLESSNQEHFQEDLTAWKAVVRVDGQPVFSQPQTLLDGSTEVSQFVSLDER